MMTCYVMTCYDDMMRGRRARRRKEKEEKEWRCPTKNKNPTLRMWGIILPENPTS